MQKWRWKLAWESFFEGLTFLLPWLVVPLAVALLLFVPQAIEPLLQIRTPAFVFLLRLSQVAGREISLGALIAALAGFAIKQWEWIKKELREEIGRARAEIDELGVLLEREQWTAALHRYRECLQCRETAWLIKETQRYLQRTWQKKAPGELLTFQRHGDSFDPGRRGDFRRQVQKGAGASTAARALLWASRNLAGEMYEQATDMMAALLAPATVLEIAQEIAAFQEDKGVRAWLRDRRLVPLLEAMAGPTTPEGRAALDILDVSRRPVKAPSLWPQDRPRDPERVRLGLAVLGIQVNPFGPPLAQHDPLLPRYKVPSPGWATIQEFSPTWVVGPPGSGKTAAALLLADQWQEDLAAACFPVYCGNLLPPEPGIPWLAQLSRLLAERLISWIGQAPRAFLEQDPPGQAAMAQLLYLWFGPEQRLALRFEEAELRCSVGIRDRLLREIVRRGEIAQPDLLDEETLFRWVSQARPADRKVTALLLEVDRPDILLAQPSPQGPGAAIAPEDLSPASLPTLEKALDQFLEQLQTRVGREHPQHLSALSLEFRLADNIDRVRRYGDSAERRGERVEIVDELNRLALATLGQSFLEMCKWVASRQVMDAGMRTVASRSLLDLVAPLAEWQVHLKAFAPEQADEPSPWKEGKVALSWSNDLLREMLDLRMQVSECPGGLDSFWPGPRGSGQGPTGVLVRLAHGSPRRLIELGNALLAQVGTHPQTPSILPEDLERIAGDSFD